MAYAMLSSYAKPEHSLAAAAAILRGFHHVYPLTDGERKHLRLLVAVRLSCSVTLGAYSYKQNPENKYLLLHAKPAWRALELLWNECQQEDVDKLFCIACTSISTKDNDPDHIDCADISFPDPNLADPLNNSRSNIAMKKCLPPSKKVKTMLNKDGNFSVTFVTGNANKLEELKRMISAGGMPLAMQLRNCKIDLPELQGHPDDIAKHKCALAAEKVNGAVITEDTSLCFTALNGLPGPYVKWFLDDCGRDGLCNLLAAHDDKSAYAQTIVAFSAGAGKDVKLFHGKTIGKIVRPRGKHDFGWDPIFQPDEGEGLTYAEMEKEGKDAISHRGRVFQKFKDFLQDGAINNTV